MAKDVKSKVGFYKDKIKMKNQEAEESNLVSQLPAFGHINPIH